MEKIKRSLVVALFYFLRIFPIKKNKIVVSCFAGKGYGFEGKAICDELLKRNMNIDIVWICSNKNEPMPQGIRTVKNSSIRSFYEYVTAKIWIDNRRKTSYFRKRKGQYYIQTWHGNVCIKAVEKDAVLLPIQYQRSAQNDSSMADLFVSGCEWRTQNYLKAFWYNGEILKGDLYGIQKKIDNQENIHSQICRQLDINQNCKIVLYAPTFRDDERLSCYDIDFENLRICLINKFGGDWCIVIRLHPNIRHLNNKISYSNYIKNASMLNDVDNLIAASDLLISDYSGVIFHGLQMQKKVILYASDYNEYITKERNLYFDFKDLPCPIAYNNNMLKSIIYSFDFNEYEISRKKFVDNLGYYNDDATILVANRIIKIICREKKNDNRLHSRCLRFVPHRTSESTEKCKRNVRQAHSWRYSR